jgi:predicted transcriptional regulator
MVMSGSISPPLLETVARRACVIKRLLEGHADKRELEAALDVSRTTVNRAVSSLSDAKCIAYRDGKWDVTLLGQLAYEEYEQLTTRYDGLTAAQPLLLHLPPRTPLDVQVLAGAEILLAEPPAPHAPITQLEDLLNDSEQIKGLSSVVLPRYVPLFHHHIVERGTDTDLVLDAELVEYLWASYPGEMGAVLETDNGMVWWLDQKPPFGLVLIDEEIVWFAVYDEDGGLKGAIVNESDAAVTWATEVFHSYRQQAEQVLVRDGSSVAVSRES